MAASLALFLIASALSSAPPAAADPACIAQWRMLYANSPDGARIEGRKADLLAALRRGSPLRVAWGEAAADGTWSVEEFSDVGFTNIMGGEHVVAQLAPALIQSHYTDGTRAGLRAPLVRWNAIIATDGRFEAVTTDATGGTVLRELAQRTTVHWYALAPDPACDRREQPDLAPKGRVNRVLSDRRAPRD